MSSDSASSRAERRRCLYRVATLAHLSLGGGLALLWMVDPIRAYAWRGEDQPLQVLTVILYLAAMMVAFTRIRSGWHDRWGWTILVLSSLFAGEEMSWVARVNRSAPAERVRFDSLHDFLQPLLQSSGRPLAIAGIAACCIILALALRRWRRSGWLLRAFHSPAFPHLTLALFFVMAAQIVDLRATKSPFEKYFFEEIPENLAALSMVVAAVAAKRQA